MDTEKIETIELVDGQIVEVEYDAELVQKYQNNYIMEEEGIGADLDVEPFDTQDTINEVPFEDMIEDGEVVVDDKND